MDLGSDFEGASPPDKQALSRPDARADLAFRVEGLGLRVQGSGRNV